MTVFVVLLVGACGGECVPGYALEASGQVKTLVERCSAADDGTLCLTAGLAVDNPVHAIGLLERSCTLGESRACAEVARRFSRGIEGPRDLSRAVALLAPSCRDDARTSPCDALASRPLWNVPQIQAARGDCRDGNPRACYALGRTFSGESGQILSEPDLRSARDALELACSADIASACLALGDLAEDGRGRGKDLDRARSAFAAACDAGSSDGCARHEQLDLPLKGCNDGDGASCAAVARIFVTAPTSAADRTRAVAYWDRACELSSARCAEAGDSLRFGTLGPDLEGAVAFLRRGNARDLPRRFDRARVGCDAGDATSCLKLGDLFYGDGELVLQPAKAREHYTRGCTLGGQTACDRLSRRYSQRAPSAVERPEEPGAQ